MWVNTKYISSTRFISPPQKKKRRNKSRKGWKKKKKGKKRRKGWRKKKRGGILGHRIPSLCINHLNVFCKHTIKRCLHFEDSCPDTTVMISCYENQLSLFMEQVSQAHKIMCSCHGDAYPPYSSPLVSNTFSTYNILMSGQLMLHKCK